MVDALREALSNPHPHESQQAVHLLVARRIEDIVQNASVKTTGYFNHAWAPDMVVRGKNHPERPIFLRFDVREASFRDDLRYLSGNEPIFVDLLAANPGGLAPGLDESREPLDVQAAVDANEDEVLVTDIPAIDEFGTRVKSDRDIRIATQQVVFGGRGMVDQRVARRIVTSWQEATTAVDEVNPTELRSALDQVESYLSRTAALDLETDLRARWIAAGQSAEAFPGREDWNLADRAPWEIARLVLSLIDSDEQVPRETWAEIADAISASALGHELYQLGAVREGRSLEELARIGLSRWTARFAYVPPLESDTLESFDWSVGRYSLGINLVNRVAYFTDIGAKWSRVPRTKLLPPAEARIESLSGADVQGVGVVTPEENVTQTLRPSASMSLAERLKQLVRNETDAAWRAARLTSLDVRVPGTSATAHIDFGRSVVRTSESIPLRTFVLLCARFVSGLTENEMTELAERLDGPLS